MKKINLILWGVFLSLLAVLLPHTAWLFAQFEPSGHWIGTAAAWAGAFAFEAAIAVLVHKLSEHIKTTPKGRRGWSRWSHRYLNAYSLGLVVCVLVSALANLAHAVEYGRSLAIFAAWGIPAQVYQVAFGAVLPLMSLLFARVLSNVSDAETETDPELAAAKQELGEMRRQVREANARAQAAEARFVAVGDLVRLFAEEKRDRILAARQAWPKLPGNAIAVIADASPSYVSEVLGQ